MSVNVELLQRTLAHIEAHPEEWNQEFFRCGSGMCFAGHAAFLGDERARWVNPDDPFSDHLEPVPEDRPHDVTKAGVIVLDRASRLLGLHWTTPLFRSDNTLDDLRRMVDNLANDRPIDYREGVETGGAS